MTDITPPNLLCSDSELEWLKRAIAGINEATRILKKSNDAAPPISAPRTAKEWAEYGKEHSEW